MASVSRHVPVLSCGGLSKRYVIPGWRVGWVVAHDRHGILKDQVTSIVAFKNIQTVSLI